ncbi:MAG: complex I NDUFA9 subunit family protein [Actinomycetota bacterium]|nr:complex I NDUFA9 subunit family protein [Actinomycetota bacterium]
MKIVVAGGTGFLGRYITRSLLDAGHAVTVLGRDPSKVPGIPQLSGADAIHGDATEPASLEGVFDGVDAVVCAVQLPNYPIEVPRKRLTFDRYDRQGAENLLAAASGAGVARFVYISGAGADPRSGKTWYRAKGRAEATLRNSELSWAIVRPSWAYGPEDRALNKFIQIAHFSPVVPRIGLRRQRIMPVFVEDIALAIARIFERNDAWERVYEIGGPQVLSMDEVIRTMLDVVGALRLVVPVPKVLAKLGTAALVLLPTPPMTPGGIEFAAQDGVVDNTEINKVLDVQPMGLRAGLERYLSGTAA